LEVFEPFDMKQLRRFFCTGKYAELPFFIKSGRPDNAGQLVTALLSVVNENKGTVFF